jgi:hypothetical protein
MEVWRTSSWMSAHAIPGYFNAPGRAHLRSIVARVVAARRPDWEGRTAGHVWMRPFEVGHAPDRNGSQRKAVNRCRTEFQRQTDARNYILKQTHSMPWLTHCGVQVSIRSKPDYKA